MSTKLISIVTPCFNEEKNIIELYNRIKAAFSKIPNCRYEQIFIDNASRDGTVRVLRQLAAKDPNVKVIINTRNFGHIRSPYHAITQARGEAVMLMVSDLQDPPELIPQFVQKWEQGYKVVLGIKKDSEESPLMFALRKLYYGFIGRISEVELIKNFTGFGLYDKEVMDILRSLEDPYPYFRGLIADLGFERAEIEYTQPRRKRGISANNFYTLYDIAMLGITTHSKVPLRIVTIIGFTLSALSLFLAFAYLLAKLAFWQHIPFGIAPLLIGVFFFASLQLFFIGLIGEYVGFIYTQVLRRPLVIEKERINFDNKYKNN